MEVAWNYYNIILKYKIYTHLEMGQTSNIQLQHIQPIECQSPPKKYWCCTIEIIARSKLELSKAWAKA